MVRKITRQSPSTCDCVIEYSWDDDPNNIPRVHTFHAIVSRCSEPAHLMIPTHLELFNTVVEEDSRPGRILGLVKQVNPLISELDFIWEYTANRVLVVRIRGQTPAGKSLLQGAADIDVGAGKVLVE